MTFPLRRAVPVALTAVAVGTLFIFIAGNAGYLREHHLIHPGTVTLMAVLIVVIFALRTIVYRIVFGNMGAAVSTADWFRLVIVSSFANSMPFSAGLAIRAIYL